MTQQSTKKRPSTGDIVGPEGIEARTLPEVHFRPVPDPNAPWGTPSHPTWRVLFTLYTDPTKRFGLDINGEVVLGRGRETPNFVDLGLYDAENLGVSRKHLKLRAEPTGLFAIDMDSKNGSLRNGSAIGANAPYPLSHGDFLSLGRLEFIVTIVKGPLGQTGQLRGMASLADALGEMAKAITSQLALDAVLKQALTMAISLTEAREAAVWLVDEQTGELFLEADVGIADEEVRRLRLPLTDNLVGEVVKSGKPLRASREPEGEPVKIKTGYLVEALVYAPLNIGGVTIGVLAAAHREPSKQFSENDEQLLTAIADFGAIAIQNARLHESTDKALARRVEELAALNELTRAVTSTLDLDGIRDILIERARSRWDVEDAALWLLDEDGETLVPYGGAQLDREDIARVPFKLGEGVVGKVAQTGQPSLQHELAEESRGSGDSTAKMRVKSMACVPLKVKGRVVGVLALINKRKGLFSDSDVAQLQGFAHPMATAIENAQLYAQSEAERNIIRAMADALGQPLMIVGHRGESVLTNEAAEALLDAASKADQSRTADEPVTGPLDQLVRGLSHGLGQTSEITVGDQHYLVTVQHAPTVGTITIMQDITHRKQLEQAQAEFVDALSHDLRTPLASIKGFAQALSSLTFSEEQRAGFLSRIVQASDRMLSMVSQLLDIALLTRSPQSQHKQCDIAREVATVIGDLEGAALGRSIELDLELEGEAYKILGDPQRLYRSVLNLISNALRYSPDGGKVMTQVRFDSKGVTIKVRDQGPGIPEADLPLIFEKYYRAKDQPRQDLGVGLGLAMVRATAEAHGGSVKAANAKGGGAEFTLRLPASLSVT